MAHHVVGRETYQPAGERHTGDVGLRPRRLRQRGPQAREELRAARRQRPALSADGQPTGIQTHREAVAEADERIARQALAAFDTLQQEARRERAELHECRHRGVEITGYVEGWLQRTLLRHVETTKNPSRGYPEMGFLVPLDS